MRTTVRYSMYCIIYCSTVKVQVQQLRTTVRHSMYCTISCSRGTASTSRGTGAVVKDGGQVQHVLHCIWQVQHLQVKIQV